MQTGTVSRLRICKRSCGFKIYIRVEHCAFSEAIHLFQSVGCVRNKLQFRTGSTESQIISLDAGLRMVGIPALDLWDLIVTVFHGNTYQSNQARGDPYKSPTRKKIHGKIDDLDDVDFVSSNVNSSREEASLYIFEDNEAVIKMIIKGRSPTMRHFSRTHRVALVCLFVCLIESVRTPRSKSNTLTPRTNSQTILDKGRISHVMNGIVFCVCPTSAILVPSIVLKRCRKEHKKMQVKKESQQSQSR